MNTPTNLLQAIVDHHAKLRRSEQKVAALVLEQPQRVIHISIADLAAQTGVSEPTVLRFCRAIGCAGFQDFKLQLAQSLASGSSFGQFEVSTEDAPEDYQRKIFDATINSLIQVRDQLDQPQLQAAIRALSKAKRVEFYGFGASGMVGQDAVHKFFRLQVSATAYSDPHMQSMSAATLGPGDVVVAISASGRTKELLHSIELVQKQGAIGIGLCPGKTPLAELCALPLNIEVQENTDIYTPLTSRIAHLTVIDVLAMGVAMSRGPDLAGHLKSVKRNLRGLRISGKHSGTEHNPQKDK